MDNFNYYNFIHTPPSTPLHTPHTPTYTIDEWIRDENITTYNTVIKEDLNQVDIQENDFIKEFYDPILQETTTVNECLQLGKIVFIDSSNKPICCISKDYLHDCCYDNNYIKYKCDIADVVDYDKNQPYLVGRSIGYYGLIKMSKIKSIIDDPEIKVVQIVATGVNANSTMSMYAIYAYLNTNEHTVRRLSEEEQQLLDHDISSVSHCQTGQEDLIYDVYHVKIIEDEYPEYPSNAEMDDGWRKIMNPSGGTGPDREKLLITKKTNKKKTNKKKTNKTNKNKTNKSNKTNKKNKKN